MGAPANQSVEPEIHITAGIRLLARLARVAEQACQETGISLPQYRLLVSLAGESLRAGELAARVGVSRPTLTSLMDGLERNGLLERKPVPSDRRGVRLEPTTRGLLALERAERALGTRLGRLVDRQMAARFADAIVEVGDALDRERRPALRSA
jgi:DNA-binding MarR family transcriptional regulator